MKLMFTFDDDEVCHPVRPSPGPVVLLARRTISESNILECSFGDALDLALEAGSSRRLVQCSVPSVVEFAGCLRTVGKSGTVILD